MMDSKCGCGSKKLCPVSFGLALGIASALAVIVWLCWVINYGPTEMMTTLNIPVPTWGDGFKCALWTLLKGFLFGFFLALFYDCICCCCPCCKKRHCGCCTKNGVNGINAK